MSQKWVNLDTNLLRTFVTGAQLGNFSDAADQIGRTQSAVSLQLKRLEERTGSKLFDKQGRSLVLNSMGETLFRYAQRILDLNDEAVAAIRYQDVAGEIRLGIPPDIAETWLPRILARIARIHPDVVIEARVDRAKTLLGDLASNGLEIAVVWDDEQLPEQAGLNIAELPVSWIGPPGVNLDDEATLPLVLMGAPCLFRQRALDALDAAGRSWRVAFTSTSLAGVWAAVEAGLGVTVRTSVGMPGHLTTLSSGSLAQGALPGKLGTIRLKAYAARNASASTQRFFDMLMEVLAHEVAPS